MAEEDHKQDWILSPEQDLLGSAAADLPALDVLTQATLCLGQGWLKLEGREATENLRAIGVLGAMAFRSARGVAILVGAGYASEAWPQARRLMEIAARVEKIDADPSGDRAKAWLEGMGERGSKLLGQDVWSFFSPGSHADGKHLPYMSIKDARGHRVYLFPDRDRTDELLAINSALYVLSVAMVLYPLVGLDADDVESLKRVTGEHVDRLAGEN
jgi:hypothetical protein